MLVENGDLNRFNRSSLNALISALEGIPYGRDFDLDISPKLEAYLMIHYEKIPVEKKKVIQEILSARPKVFPELFERLKIDKRIPYQLLRKKGIGFFQRCLHKIIKSKSNY